MTPFGLLATAIRARASSVPGSQVPPAAILWTDARREWSGALAAARLHIPELLVLGEYSPDDRTGPAIWLRCVVDRTIELPNVPAAHPPIIYLPGVERGQLRAGEACPETLRPLVELMYRGLLWHHPNGRDWSVRAFLMLRADGVPAGPGLDIANDSETGAALLRAIGEVAQTPVEQLRGRCLDAGDFNRLVRVDVVRDILRWMGSPQSTRDQMDETKWEAFRDEARRELGFDPATGADVEAGARLAEGTGRWNDVWERFTEAPQNFRGVAEVLGRSRPGDVLSFDRDRWPDLNEDDETAVRDDLDALPGLPHRDACRKVRQLEEDHRHRREWVWAAMGRSPLARVLEPLASLAGAAEKSIGGASPDAIARVYAERGWQADRGAREALAASSPECEQVVAKAVRHLLRPWLDESARTFQAAVRSHPLRSADAEAAEVAPPASPVNAAEGECLFFVDGLRYELARCLKVRLEERGLAAAMHTRWSALPTVTATAKPAVTPVAGDIAGDGIGAEFLPVFRDSRRPARAGELRDAMKERGYEIVGDGVLELGPAVHARGWEETDAIDRHGHYHHRAAGFARQVEDELGRLVRRVTELLDSGWRSVRIVTDHGWLLLPGGLPMVTLPLHLTESQWARCAVPAAGSRPDAALYPWHWNGSEHFASPPGIACFSRRPEYAHGGLSVQECLIPDIRVTATDGAGGAARADIRSVSWVRMRCNIRVDVGADSATADLRLGSPSGESVASSTKALDADGCASLILSDDLHEDAALVLVVTGSDGRILAQRATRKGGSSV